MAVEKKRQENAFTSERNMLSCTGCTPCVEQRRSGGVRPHSKQHSRAACTRNHAPTRIKPYPCHWHRMTMRRDNRFTLTTPPCSPARALRARLSTPGLSVPPLAPPANYHFHARVQGRYAPQTTEPARAAEPWRAVVALWSRMQLQRPLLQDLPDSPRHMLIVPPRLPAILRLAAGLVVD